MANAVVQVQDVSKAYRIGLRDAVHDTFVGALTSWLRAPKQNWQTLRRLSQLDESTEGEDVLWALRQVSFDVDHGEVLGIIGKNGAGKSTLLKLLSRITEPTAGRIILDGRVASLLEVGTGFHPELTGRENIFLNGTILGMTRREVVRKFDEIVAFSGVERFIDTPVKRYSSGMKVRLAFAVAAHLEPEILVVDEVLSVGDAEFQAKCLDKMHDVSSAGGRTVLFVSHDLGAVQRLCTRCILLHQGKVDLIGPTADVISAYLNKGVHSERVIGWEPAEAPGRDGVTLLGICVADEQGSTYATLTTSSTIAISVEYHLARDVHNLRIALTLLDAAGAEIFCISDFWHQPESRRRQPGTYRSTCQIPAYFLNVGRYHLIVDVEAIGIKGFASDHSISFVIADMIENQMGFTISKKPPGIIHPRFDWEIESVEAHAFE